jgi:hypothetical protein
VKDKGHSKKLILEENPDAITDASIHGNVSVFLELVETEIRSEIHM